MSYATQSDALAQLGEHELVALTDRENVGTINADVLLPALAAASAEIDMYLASRYATPLTVVPGLVVTYCVDIARYRLCGNEVEETEAVRVRYKDAIRFLEGVRDGKNTLGGAVASAPADATQNLVSVVNSGSRVFSRSRR